MSRNREADNARRRERYASDPEHAAQVRERNRLSAERRREKKSAYNAAYRERNRNTLNAKKRQHYRENRDRLLAVRRAYYAANRDAILEANHAYYAANRERLLEYRRTYRAANRAVILAATYRAACAAAGVEPTGTLTEDDIAALVAEYGGLCAYCGIAEADSFDHVIPVSAGGPHDRENVVPACIPCNSSKHNRPLDEWLREAAP